MNPNLFFWNRWLPVYRWLTLGLFVLLGVVVVIYLTQKVIGAGAVINWQTANEVQDTSFDIDSFTKGIFNFTTSVPSFLVVEWFDASDMQINTTATYLYGIIAGVALVWLLSVVTSLPRWWYLGSMMAFIGLMVSFQPDILQVWGLTNSTILIATLIVFLPVSYYFHAFRSDISIAVRLVVFSVLLILTVLVWFRFAETSHPLMSVLAYGTRVLALLTILFIFLIAHEIPSHLLQLITSSGMATGRNSIFHFTVITFFYAGNLVVSYLYNSGLIEWNFLYLNGFYLVLISIVLGIWGFRKRLESFVSDPYGTILYVALAIMALGTLGYALATGNDPMMDALEDVIIYSHLAMGLAFYAYVFVNFRGPMSQGLPVHRIVYQPRIMPFGLTFALAGLIMLGMFFRAGMLPFNQAIAGYHNYLGDLYFAQKNTVLSETYYKKALLFQQRNHKSNYALATLAKQHDNPIAMAAYLQDAIANKPTPYTYAALAQLYKHEDSYFEALFTLRQGTQRFPESGELFNNLALLYEQSKVLDSAYYFFSEAQQRLSKPEVVQTNLLAFWAKNFSNEKLDSVLKNSPPSDYYSIANNRLVISNKLQKVDAQPYQKVGEGQLTREQFAYLYNYSLNHKSDPDTAVDHDIKQVLSLQENSIYTEFLDFGRAIHLYHTHNVLDGIELLKDTEQGTEGESSARLNKVLGTWYLQQDAPGIATYRFEKAVKTGDSTNLLNLAFAITERGNLNQALPLWETVRVSPLPQFIGVANSMTKVTKTMLGAKTDSLSDAEKVALVYFSHSEDLTPVVSSISDLSYRASALLYLAENHLRKQNVAAAESDLQALQSLTITDANAKRLIQELELNVLWLKKDWTALAKAAQASNSPRKAFYQAEIAANANKLAEAEKYYLSAMKNRPFDETVTLAVQQFYLRRNNADRAYQILTQALQINPAAPEVQKAYILQSLDLNLTDYAAQGMEQLRDLVSPADYQAFVPKYEAKRALVEKRLAEWQ